MPAHAFTPVQGVFRHQVHQVKGDKGLELLSQYLNKEEGEIDTVKILRVPAGDRLNFFKW